MAQSCSICNHPKRLDIERLVLQGKNIEKITRDFGVSRGAISAHRAHISRQMTQSIIKKQMIEDLDLVNEFTDIIHRTKIILVDAENKGHNTTALAALKEWRSAYETWSKIFVAVKEAEQIELDLVKARSGELTDDERRAQSEKLDILTMDEMRVYEALLLKIWNQDESIQIPYPMKNRYKRVNNVLRPDLRQSDDSN